MILLNPNQSLEIITTSSAKIDYNITINNFDAQGNSTSWQPLEGSITSAGSTLITNNNTTIQQISFISLRNSSGSVSNTLTVSRVSRDVAYPITPTVDFAFGEYGNYNSSTGWLFFNAQGFEKFVGEQGPIGPSGVVASIVAGTNVTVDSTDPANPIVSATAGATDWGDIGGTLSDQTDLQTALDLKAPIASPTFTGTVGGITKAMVGLGNVDNTSDANKPVSTAQQTALDLKLNIPTPIVGATKTKVTYDANGLIVSGTDATTADIADSTNRRYLTDAQLVVVGNTSGTNTGDQTNISGNAATVTTNANLTGVVTSVGNATSIANGAITNAMLANPAVSDLTGSNSGDNAPNSLYSGLISGPTYSTGTSVLNFGNEQNLIVNTISYATVTSANFRGITFLPTETSETSLDDFTLNGVTFAIENIVDSTSFDIRASAINNASGNYTIKYQIATN